MTRKRERVEERFEVRNPEHRENWLAMLATCGNELLGPHLYRKEVLNEGPNKSRRRDRN